MLLFCSYYSIFLHWLGGSSGDWGVYENTSWETSRAYTGTVARRRTTTKVAECLTVIATCRKRKCSGHLGGRELLIGYE